MALLVASCTAAPQSGGRGAVTRPLPQSREGAARCRALPALVARIRRGYVPGLSPDILFVPRAPNYVGTDYMPAHSGPWDYLARVPLVLFGPGYVRSRGPVGTRATMADLAPTAAHLVGFDGLGRRAGRVLHEALSAPPASPPRLVLTLVWDGGGRNVLARHARAWPHLASLEKSGVSYARMTIGSSPSVTPPVHATLGTGVFPRRHGIPGLYVRSPGEAYVDPLLYLDPSTLRTPTLADLYDRSRNNRPVVGMIASANWHLGMIGHGASLPGADRDPVVLVDENGRTYSNESLYALPQVEGLVRLTHSADDLDRSDGRADGQWRGHSLDDPTVRFASPAATRYEEILLRRLIQAEGFGRDRVPDLLYVNFKAADLAGHRWGLTSREVGAVLRAQDVALGRLVRLLDREVGPNRWVLMITADHGQTLYPHESGGWPIGGGELRRDVNAALDRTRDGVDLVDKVVSAGAYVRADQLAANDLSLRRVARWIAAYTAAENQQEKTRLPGWYKRGGSAPLFDAVMIGNKVAFRSCSGRSGHPRPPRRGRGSAGDRLGVGIDR